MDVALYDPVVGYYAKADSPLGPAGDFYTAPQLHPLFGATVGRRVAEILADLGRGGGPLRVVELGPGDGELAAGIIAAVASIDGPHVDYVLVERAPARAASALHRSQRAAEGTRVRARLAPSLGEDGPFRGVVLGHEFWDAQPVRRLRSTAKGWEEIGVRWEGNRWVEVARPMPESERPVDLPAPLEAGSVIEVSPRAEASLREIADHLEDGRGIFIDFGAEQEEILRAHRFGTLTALRRHQVLESAVEDAGDADLSAYVNFTRMRVAAQRSGLTWVNDRSQAEALVAWGLSELKARWEGSVAPAEALKGHLAVKKLLFGFPQFRAVELAADAVPVR